jgi:hypothetical protein
MPSLIRFLGILGVFAALCYAGMLALVSFVEPTQREFAVIIPQERFAKKAAGAAHAGANRPVTTQELQGVDPDRLVGVLENLKVSR